MASPKGAAIAKDGDGLRRYLQQIQNLTNARRTRRAGIVTALAEGSG